MNTDTNKTSGPKVNETAFPCGLAELIGQFEIVASNAVGWGKASTLDQAAANCKKETRRKATRFAIVPKGSELDALSITYPLGAKFTATQL